jgi:hypothetical protein
MNIVGYSCQRLDMDISHRVILTAPLLPLGEEQDEGMKNQAIGLMLSPLPNPLPEYPKNGHKGEGVYGIAVVSGTHRRT